MAELVFHILRNLGEYLSFNRAVSRWKQLSYKKPRIDNHDTEIYGCWHELPKDIMEIVVKPLSLADRIRLNAVCKAWKLLFQQEEIRTTPEIPWLLLPKSPKAKHLSFCSLSDGKIIDVKLPKAVHRANCCGSSKGWFVFVKETPFDSEIYLLNPFSGELHQLPSLATIPTFYDFKDFEKDPYDATFIYKIELSSADLSECTVAAICGLNDMLACCRPNDKCWTIFQEEENHIDSDGDDDEDDDGDDLSHPYCNILFSNDKLYLSTTSSKTNATSTYTLELPDNHQVALILIPEFIEIEADEEEEEEQQQEVMHGFHIVKDVLEISILVGSSDGEVFLVRKFADLFEKNLDVIETEVEEDSDDIFLSPSLSYFNTRKFEIFKLDHVDGKTIYRSKVESLGDRALFWAGGGSLLCSTRNLNGIKGNCVYFASDNGYNTREYHPLVCRESGVFYLEDGKIERSFPSVNLPYHSLTSWSLPTRLVG